MISLEWFQKKSPWHLEIPPIFSCPIKMPVSYISPAQFFYLAKRYLILCTRKRGHNEDKGLFLDCLPPPGRGQSSPYWFHPHSCSWGWIEQLWSVFEMLDGSEGDLEDAEANVPTSEAVEAQCLKGILGYPLLPHPGCLWKCTSVLLITPDLCRQVILHTRLPWEWGESKT